MRVAQRAELASFAAASPLQLPSIKGVPTRIERQAACGRTGTSSVGTQRSRVEMTSFCPSAFSPSSAGSQRESASCSLGGAQESIR